MPLPTVFASNCCVAAGASSAVTLAARYYRESGAFAAGAVEGQAVITVTYR